MNLRRQLVAVFSSLILLAFMSACTDTPGAGNGNGNGDNCPEGQEYDGVSGQCVPIGNGGNGNQNQGDPDAGIDDADINQTQPENTGEGEPWGDDSGDGIPNRYDNCPDHYNPDQIDTSGDGVGDVCDNCPDHANPDQEYSPDNPVDDRGIIMGDACAPGVIYADTVTDDSGDGVPTIMDNCPDHYNPPLEVGCDCPESDPYCAECICTCPDDMYPCSGCEQLDTSGDGVGDKCDNCPNHYNPNQTQSPGNPADDRGVTMGDACAPEPNNIPICALQDTEFETVHPNVYISLDLSGSMSATDTPSGQSRMQEALDGMDLIAEQLHDQIQFGLGTYPPPPVTSTTSPQACTANHVLDVGEYTELELKNTWASYSEGGCTPMRAAMEDIRDNNRLGQNSGDDQVNAALLITDGIPNCDPPGQCGGGGASAINNVVSVIEDLQAQNVLTFVVGFKIDDPALNDFAEAGGTEEPFLAVDADELAEAMADVADLLVSCDYVLATEPEDPDKIWVSVNGEYLDTDGYTFDPAENVLSLNDDTCQEIRDTDSELLELEIELGCASECVPEEPQGLCDMWYESCGEDICSPCEPEVCDGTDNNCSGVVDDYCLECSLYQEPCETTDDCCEPFICNEEGFCDRECYPLGAPCRSNDECCQQCAILSGEEVGECITG